MRRTYEGMDGIRKTPDCCSILSTKCQGHSAGLAQAALRRNNPWRRFGVTSREAHTCPGLLRCNGHLRPGLQVYRAPGREESHCSLRTAAPGKLLQHPGIFSKCGMGPGLRPRMLKSVLLILNEAQNSEFRRRGLEWCMCQRSALRLH